MHRYTGPASALIIETAVCPKQCFSSKTYDQTKKTILRTTRITFIKTGNKSRKQTFHCADKPDTLHICSFPLALSEIYAEMLTLISFVSSFSFCGQERSLELANGRN